MGISTIPKYIRAEVGILPTIFSLLMITKVLGFRVIPNADIFCYAALIIITILFMINKPKLNGLCGLFIIFLPLALLLASPPAIFNSWVRLGLFTTLFIVVSPLIQSEYAIRFRIRTLKITLWLCWTIATVSFVGFFVGINMMRNFGGELQIVAVSSTFGGITSHSMLLGPISGIGALFMAFQAMYYQKKICWIFVIPCIGSMLFASSRAAFIAFIAGTCVILYFFSGSKVLFCKRVLIIVALLSLSYPLWNFALDGMRTKNKMVVEMGENSRSEKWNLRINEFKENPIVGYGFVAVDPRYDDVGPGGVIEPGSSWLAVLSMTGILGFVIFCTIMWKAFKNPLRYHTLIGALLGACLTIMAVHMFAEGHVFSGGSYLCFLVWLIVGCATDYKPEVEL